MGKGRPAGLLVELVHREILDKAQLKAILVDQLQASGDLGTDLAGETGRQLGGVGDEIQYVTGFECGTALELLAVGVGQEKKAANALEALKNMTAPTARVLREGEESVVPAAQLVPGDVVYLEDGCIVPADIRIIQDSNMKLKQDQF